MAKLSFILIGGRSIRKREAEEVKSYNDERRDNATTSVNNQRGLWSDVEEGGETIFPTAKGNISVVPWWNELSDYGVCLVITGNKWSFTKRMHVEEYKV
ncbi:probable prolyl 4-hydroxylase 10 [Hibiscus syriacus]|uniref:probable prolyl 4-hydroxylase 10 n=1 Tax=Hibiscus syriacus TaxID=106335 RepID=UPI001923E737|nr:probable prolyl 4-hydroxylase 10 [Hibiscus syriacus]